MLGARSWTGRRTRGWSPGDGTGGAGSRGRGGTRAQPRADGASMALRGPVGDDRLRSFPEGSGRSLARFLLWADRHRLAAVPRRRAPGGALVVLGALGVLAAGRSLSSIMLEGISLVVAVAGLVLWAQGPRRLRAAAFPVAFLVFMLPLPRSIVRAVTPDLQNLVARFAGVVLSAVGVPHHQYGIVIELPRSTLEIAEGCNGLRFLMALVTLAAALAQATQRTLTRKVVLAAFAVPLAILANAGRVVAVCLAAYYVGPQAAGMPHHTIGKGVWALTLLPLLFLAAALRRHRRERRGPRRQPLHSTSGWKDG
ncbi:MAG: hypothetical protein DMF80_06170 [Acidobacteria bacterium]|nr:MAG: hypothetical protein DMF80_06170 [Acidobacteriota bacterium]